MTPETPTGASRVEDWGRVHLIGAGGAGMSAVAALLAARGVVVSGSDARDSVALAAVRASGVRTWVGHDAAHVEEADVVVVSTAVRESNPELARARALGLRVVHRSQALAALMDGRTAVAVAGAHGKTTTSAMTAVILSMAGLDPSYAIGGTVLGVAGPDVSLPVGGARNGTGRVFVAEADESDGSFLAYAPTIAVVTNVEADHLDHYGSLAAFEAVFVEFAERIVDGGWLIACADDAGARRLVETVRTALSSRGVRVVTYGTGDAPVGADAHVTVSDFVALGDGSRAVVRTRAGAPWLPATSVALDLAVPGVHNAANATAAWIAAVLLGVDPVVAAAGVAAFRGTGRRFEDRGSAGGVRVVDDYAHHPTEVAALLRAARSVAGSGRVLVVFQPHLFSRTRVFAHEFADALALADVVVVTGVYAAREDPEPGVTGALIVDAMAGSGEYVADRIEAALRLAGAARAGDLVLTVGAGDVTELGPIILGELARRADDRGPA